MTVFGSITQFKEIVNRLIVLEDLHSTDLTISAYCSCGEHRDHVADMCSLEYFVEEHIKQGHKVSLNILVHIKLEVS